MHAPIQWRTFYSVILLLCCLCGPIAADASHQSGQFDGVLIVHCKTECSKVYVDGRLTRTEGEVRQYQLRLKEGPHIVRIVDSDKCNRSPFYFKRDQTTYVVQWKTCPLVNDCCPDGCDLQKDRDYWAKNVRAVSHSGHHRGHHGDHHHHHGHHHSPPKCEPCQNTIRCPRCVLAENHRSSHSTHRRHPTHAHGKQKPSTERDSDCEQCRGKEKPQLDPKKKPCEQCAKAKTCPRCSGHASKKPEKETEPVCKECQEHEQAARKQQQQEKDDSTASRDDGKDGDASAQSPAHIPEISAPTEADSAPQKDEPVSTQHVEPSENSCAANEKRWSYSWDDGRPEWLQIRKDAKISNGVMELAGGAILPLDINEQLLEACEGTGELTIEVVFQTDKHDQKGPARIISFSKDTGNRNFTLGQEDDWVVFRLRTSDRGYPNGTSDIKIAPIQFDRPMHVIISYDGKKLLACVNGKSVQKLQQVTGNLRNWESQHLIIGSEVVGDRAGIREWHGSVERFSITNRAIGEADAKAMFKKVTGVDNR